MRDFYLILFRFTWTEFQREVALFGIMGGSSPRYLIRYRTIRAGARWDRAHNIGPWQV